jgi:Tfp pilus tip-associated adhesin PilY1
VVSKPPLEPKPPPLIFGGEDYETTSLEKTGAAMGSRITPLRAFAALLLFLFTMWPNESCIGDLIGSPLLDPVPIEQAVPKAFATKFQTNSGSTADGMAIGAIGSSNHLMLYQCRYNSVDWSGDVVASLARWENGRLVLGAQQWRAAEQFQSPGLDWRARRIVTYSRQGYECRGVPFHWDDLSDRQQIRLLGDTPAEIPDPSAGRELVAYLRGKPSTRFRHRNSQLGDIMNGIPVLAGRTLFVGANDGMLHAFDAYTGRERFAYVPNLVFGNLRRLGSSDYHQHPRYYVDAAPTVGQVLASSQRRRTYLVGGLGRGGRGYYCLLLSSTEQESAGRRTSQNQNGMSFDQYGAGASEEAVSRLVQWEYPAVDMADDAMDNDGNGIVDESGENDPHLGYSFSEAYAVNANAPSGDYRPVVIFGNGYGSSSGQAVLYVLEAHSGRILRKIKTGAGGRNGLSTPALIDIDLDRRIDYAYAGDLKGNLWKFDLTAPDPARWCIVSAAGTRNCPRPLFQATGLSITGRPDVMAVNPVCSPDASGVMVIFGTGAHPGYGPVRTRLNAIFGVWDNDRMDPVVSWFVELSSISSVPGQSGERITGAVAIRGGRAVVTAYIPGTFPGQAHGAVSRLYVFDACTGTPVGNADGTADYPMTFYGGISSNPVILKNPSQPYTDHFLAWDSAGRIVQSAFSGERQGRVYWRQNFKTD